MEWMDWIGKTIFIKLKSGCVFTPPSKVLTYEKPYLAITDKYGLPVVINVSEILIIREEGEESGRADERGI